MDGSGQSLTTMDEKKAAAQRVPIRVLLLDDRIDNLILRSAILRKHGYEAIKAATIEEAEAHLHEADIAASGPLKSPLLKGSVAIDEGKVSMPPVSPEAAGTYKALINPKFAIDMKTNNPVSMTIGTGNFLLTGSGLLHGTFELPDLEALMVVEKGSIAVEGISLTVAGVEGDEIWIAILPHTYSATNLYTLRPGMEVNLEVDVLGKYAESRARVETEEKSGITVEYLLAHGY